MRQQANRSRADSKGPLGRLAPLAKARILPNSRVNSVSTLLVSLNSTTRSTMAVAFSLDTAGQGGKTGERRFLMVERTNNLRNSGLFQKNQPPVGRPRLIGQSRLYKYPKNTPRQTLPKQLPTTIRGCVAAPAAPQSGQKGLYLEDTLSDGPSYWQYRIGNIVLAISYWPW